MERLGRQYQLDYVQATARHRHSSLIRPSSTEPAAGAEPHELAAAAAAASAGAEGMAGAEEGPAAVSAAAAAAAAAVAAGGDELPVTGNAWGTCDVCRCALTWEVQAGVCMQSCCSPVLLCAVATGARAECVFAQLADTCRMYGRVCHGKCSTMPTIAAPALLSHVLHAPHSIWSRQPPQDALLVLLLSW